VLPGSVIFLGMLFLPVINLFKADSKIFGVFMVTLPLAVLFFARVLDGFTGGNISVINSYLADYHRREKKPECRVMCFTGLQENIRTQILKKKLKH